MASKSINFNFKRGGAEPLDASLVVSSANALDTILTASGTRYAGMLVSDTSQPGIIFQLNADRNAWIPIGGSGGGGTSSKYAVDIGNGTSKDFTITHNLNTLDVLIQVRQNGIHKVIEDICGKKIIDANSVLITFGEIISLNSHRVVIFG